MHLSNKLQLQLKLQSLIKIRHRDHHFLWTLKSTPRVQYPTTPGVLETETRRFMQSTESISRPEFLTNCTCELRATERRCVGRRGIWRKWFMGTKICWLRLESGHNIQIISRSSFHLCLEQSASLIEDHLSSDSGILMNFLFIFVKDGNLIFIYANRIMVRVVIATTRMQRMVSRWTKRLRHHSFEGAKENSPPHTLHSLPSKHAVPIPPLKIPSGVGKTELRNVLTQHYERFKTLEDEIAHTMTNRLKRK